MKDVTEPYPEHRTTKNYTIQVVQLASEKMDIFAMLRPYKISLRKFIQGCCQLAVERDPIMAQVFHKIAEKEATLAAEKLAKSREANKKIEKIEEEINLSQDELDEIYGIDMGEFTSPYRMLDEEK